MANAKQVIAARAGQELKDGQIINLGIGLPTLIANYVPEGVDVVIQTENGAIGVGPAPVPGCEDRDRANAGNQPISLVPGGSYFDSATSFAMIRGGHVDATFLGTLQVDEKGNIANWIVPGKMLAGMGGAMDLITGAKIVYIVSEHCSKDGASKLMTACTFPLTGPEECDGRSSPNGPCSAATPAGASCSKGGLRLHARRHRHLYRDGLHGGRRRQTGRLRRRRDGHREGLTARRAARASGRTDEQGAGPHLRPRSVCDERSL